LAAELSPLVRERLGVASASPHEIWHLERLRRDGAAHNVMKWNRHEKRAIRIEVSEQAIQAAPRFILAHELVHRNMRGTGWDHSPLVVEEGIAETIAFELDPDGSRERRDSHGVALFSMEPEVWARTLTARR